MKCLILSFFAAILGYALLFNGQEERMEKALSPLNPAINVEKSGMQNDSVAAIRLHTSFFSDIRTQAD